MQNKRVVRLEKQERTEQKNSCAMPRNEEQPTFEQIVSILPQSILAKTKETAENTSADESEDIIADYDVEI